MLSDSRTSEPSTSAAPAAPAEAAFAAREGGGAAAQRLGRGCLHVVTGPNSGGKSTYLRAIGLAVVISQAGGLPPAWVACLPVLTRLSLVAAGAGAAGGGGLSPAPPSCSSSGLGLRALASSAGFARGAIFKNHWSESRGSMIVWQR